MDKFKVGQLVSVLSKPSIPHRLWGTWGVIIRIHNYYGVDLDGHGKFSFCANEIQELTMLDYLKYKLIIAKNS